MKFSTKEDLEIPIEDTFKLLTDFDKFEQIFMRRGVKIARVSGYEGQLPGMRWTADAEIRGKRREIDVTLTTFDPHDALVYFAKSSGFESTLEIDLVSLSAGRTRLRIAFDLKPKTLSSRLLVQSARLARNTLNKRYKMRVAHFAGDLEDRHKSSLKRVSS